MERMNLMNAACIRACNSDIFNSFLEFPWLNNILDDIVKRKDVI